MKKIELFWNIVYYGIYTFDVYLRTLMDYLNPFNLIHKMKSVKKFYSNRGVEDVPKLRNRILGNRKTGISSIRSSGLIGGFLVLIECGVLNVFEGISKISLMGEIWKSQTNFITYLIVIVGPALLINHFLLFKKDKYLNYFDEFDKMDESKKRTYYLLGFISVVLIISFFFLSFLLL